MKVALLGASRGLGWEVADQGIDLHSLFLSSRKTDRFGKWVNDPQKNVTIYSCDYSQESQLMGLVDSLRDFQPEAIYYFAGGGPFGNFETKNWKDHVWAWHVSFLTPAFLLHHFLQDKIQGCQQMIFIGSMVAEDKPDPKAASYCAAKHALKGLISSVNLEGANKDVRLFSPSFMNTDLLPPNAYPRHQGVSIHSPQQVAETFWNWALNSDGEKHFRYI